MKKGINLVVDDSQDIDVIRILIDDSVWMRLNA